MEVNIKKLNKKAVLPTYAKDGDAGMDLTAVSVKFDEYGNVVYGTGLAFEIPKRYVGLLFPRSSNSKKDLRLTNSVGVIDSGYRGEVTFKYRKDIRTILGFKGFMHKYFNCIFKKLNTMTINNIGKMYEIGDRIGQLIIMPYPCIEFKEIQELTETDRGIGGYGSTGK